MTDPLRPREIAAEVVGRVMRGGAFSNVLADQATAGLSVPDRARVKALVFGLLRHVEVVDERISDAARRDPGSIEADVLDRLRISGFEVLYGRAPAPIAVSAGVDLVRRIRPKAAGLANAVLRRVARPGQEPPRALQLPVWLTEALRPEWGEEQVAAFALASASEPERVARSRPGAETGYAGVAGAIEMAAGPAPPGAVVQDAASIAVGNAVAAEPGMRVLEMAAAPGGKTLHLLDQVGGDGVVVAMDRHVRRARDAARRVPGAYWVVGDGATPPFAPGSFDRVLLDAPCSGLGTLRRRPEIRFRVTPDDVDALARLQERMLEAGMGLLAPGGRLVYSVCTVTPRETVDVVAGHDLMPAEGPGEIWGKGRLLGPHLTGTDGMFIAVHDG